MLPRTIAIAAASLGALLGTMPARAAGVPAGIVAESRLLEKQQQQLQNEPPLKIQTQLVSDVGTVLEGVPLFQPKQAQATLQPTFHLRPAFGCKGPVALLDVRF